MKPLLILLFPAVLLAQWNFETNPIVVDSASVTVDSVCNEGDKESCLFSVCFFPNSDSLWEMEYVSDGGDTIVYSFYSRGEIDYENSTYQHRWIYGKKIDSDYWQWNYGQVAIFTPYEGQHYRICKVCKRKELITFTIHWHYQADEYNLLDKEIK